MTKHTPGPWRYSDVNRAIYTDNGEVEICRGLDDISPEERGNIALLTSAPDLLAALEAILPEFEMLYEQFDPDGELGAWIEWSTMAQNAINKARGMA